MAYFAQIDESNIVTNVLVIPDDQASRGQQFLADDLGLGGTWIETSDTGAIRYNYAAIGYTYDPSRDAFIPPKPFASWVLNEDTCLWDAPVPYPTDGEMYLWDEDGQAWVAVEQPAG